MAQLIRITDVSLHQDKETHTANEASTPDYEYERKFLKRQAIKRIIDSTLDSEKYRTTINKSLQNNDGLMNQSQKPIQINTIDKTS